MKLLSRLTDAFSGIGAKGKQREELRKILYEAVSDGTVTDSELQAVYDYFKQSKLKENDLYQLRLEAFLYAVKIATSDRRVNAGEEKAIELIHQKLQLPFEVLEQARASFFTFRYLDELEKGNLPNFTNIGLVLKSGELCHWLVHAWLMEERVTNRYSVGGSKGASIRIMKGVTYRVGASKRQYFTETGIVPIASGMFYITNQRLVFSGDRKSFDIGFNRLLETSLYGDGLRIAATSRQYPLMLKFANDNDVEAVGAFLSHLVNS